MSSLILHCRYRSDSFSNPALLNATAQQGHRVENYLPGEAEYIGAKLDADDHIGTYILITPAASEDLVNQLPLPELENGFLGVLKDYDFLFVDNLAIRFEGIEIDNELYLVQAHIEKVVPVAVTTSPPIPHERIQVSPAKTCPADPASIALQSNVYPSAKRGGRNENPTRRIR